MTNGATDQAAAPPFVVVVPDEPPVLGPRALRTLLDLLVAGAEAEYGPEWREHLEEWSE